MSPNSTLKENTVTTQLLMLFKLAYPIILGNFAFALLGITDIMMAGLAGTSDQAGVAIGGSLFFPAMTFVIGMVSALHPVISRHCGAKRKDLIPQEHAHAVLACFIIGMILMFILLFLAFFVIEMDADKRMEQIAKEYIFYIAFTIPMFAFNNTARAYCEAMGNTAATFYFGVLAVVLNVPLNYIFIFGTLGMPQMGGTGCGVASLIAMVISGIVIYTYMLLHKDLKDYNWVKNKHGVTKKGLMDFIKLSMPLGISTSVECSCFTLIALILSPLGSTAVSAHSITMSLTNFVFNIPLSLGVATAIMVGYAIGQNNINNIRLNIKAAYVSMGFSIVISCGILFFGARILPNFFSEDVNVLTLAYTLMLFAVVNQIFEGMQTIQAFILRGFKDTTSILIVTCIAFYVVALPVGYGLCYDYIRLPFDHVFGEQGLTGPRGFWIGLLAGLFTAAALYRIRVLHHYRAIKHQIAEHEHDAALNKAEGEAKVEA